ncbi:MAG TPA: bacillithiol biosynthesis BshC, partial [Candidatus Acetothermia bacterium]|nr:bacillithiol biosynthesis BshC [Candidatus Acetothermia bacterium]
ESFTVITHAEADLISRFETSASAILSSEFSSTEAKRAFAPSDLEKGFADARDAITADLAPLFPLVEALDPGLVRSCEGTRLAALRALAQLEDRALRANLAKRGLSLRALQQLRNTILPRGRLQERVFPLPYFINRHGPRFVERLVAMAELDNTHHRMLTWEDDD